MFAALPYPRQTAELLIGLAVAVLIWHLLLPGWFYHTSAVYLEGPLPALIGAAFGLWLHQKDAARMRAVGACGWAIFASIAAVGVLSTATFGPLSAIAGLYSLLRAGFHLPFVDVPRAFGSGYAPYVFWMGVKTLLCWGALAYVVLLFTRFDLKTRLRDAVAGHSVRRTFSAEQRKQWSEYQRRYVEAVKAGGTPPPAPAGLVPPGAAPASTWHNRAKFAYWAVRIGVAIAGLLGLWTAFKDQLFGIGGQIFLRGLFGG
jgi:hypothetical protein